MDAFTQLFVTQVLNTKLHWRTITYTLLQKNFHFYPRLQRREKSYLATSCLSVRPFVCPSFRMHQFGSHLTDVCELLYWTLLLKYAEKLQICLRSDRNIIRHFIWRTKHTLHCWQAYKVAIKSSFSIQTVLCCCLFFAWLTAGQLGFSPRWRSRFCFVTFAKRFMKPTQLSL